SSTAPVSFTWSNSKGAAITGYRLIVSTTPDFAGYNQKNKVCRNNIVCFSTTVQKPSYSLSNLKSMLQPDSDYYWRVEAINNQGTSTSSIAGFAFGALAKPIDIKYTIVAMPNITAVTTDFPSIEQGKTIKISAKIDAAVPTGYAVKVDYGNGLVAMAGSSPDYSVTITPVKSSNYTVGIYDSKNVLKSNKVTGNFEVTAPIPTNVAPVLSLNSNVDKISKVGVNNTYTIELSATDDNGDLRQITVDWGDNSSDSANVNDGEKLSLAHIYVTAGISTWTATAYDYGDLSSNIITQAVTVEAPVITPPTSTTPTTTPTTVPTTPVVATPPEPPRYFEIAEDGTELPDQAILMGAGKSAPLVVAGHNSWACTRDDKTKLIWEIKTNDGSLRDKDWTYSWYEPDTTKNGGYAGAQNAGICKGSTCNTSAYIKALNDQKLCGQSNWRLPTKKELEGLVVCPNGLSGSYVENEISDICAAPTSSPTDPLNSTSSVPTIDTVYFPNTQTDWYWTSDTYVPTLSAKAKPSASKTRFNDSAWHVLFYDGRTRPDNKGNAARIRLVSG
ncbi:MAG: DUF1566 domain-containing protein, partial [Methylococcales bacterium]|nr:DUF1566 domain-containing protein [Methylococcales bacterium]